VTRSEVGECSSTSGTSGGQGSRPSQEAENIPILSRRNTPKHQAGVVRATGRGLPEVQGRKPGRKVRAARRGEKALEKDPERSSGVRKNGGRDTARECGGPMPRDGSQGQSEAAAIG